jgi:hypothetical protein
MRDQNDNGVAAEVALLAGLVLLGLSLLFVAFAVLTVLDHNPLASVREEMAMWRRVASAVCYLVAATPAGFGGFALIQFHNAVEEISATGDVSPSLPERAVRGVRGRGRARR